MEEFKELRVYLQTGDYKRTGWELNLSYPTLSKRVRQQAIEILQAFDLIPNAYVWWEEADREQQIKYSNMIDNIQRNKLFFLDLLAKYDGQPKKLPNLDDRLISSLTVAEFKILISDILDKYIK